MRGFNQPWIGRAFIYFWQCAMIWKLESFASQQEAVSKENNILESSNEH